MCSMQILCHQSVWMSSEMARVQSTIDHCIARNASISVAYISDIVTFMMEIYTKNNF